MTLPQFTLHRPKTLDGALEAAARFGSAAAFMGGGTDLLPAFQQRLGYRPHIVSLAELPELRRLETGIIGAGIPLASAAQADCLPELLRSTALRVAGPALREAATVGGNVLLSGRCIYYNQSELCRSAHDRSQSCAVCMKAEGDACLVVPQKERCYSVSSGDLAPVLVALNAEFRLRGPTGERCIAAADFYLPDGIRSNLLAPGEILTEILLPEGAAGWPGRCWKLRSRSAMDFPEAALALVRRPLAAGGFELRAVLGALAGRPLLAVRREAELTGSPADTADQLWRELAPQAETVRNTHFRPHYRREMARLHLGRLLAELLN